MMPEFWIAKVDAQGRITIPAELRRQLDLHPGTRVVFTPRKDGSILLQSLRVWKREQRAQKNV
jgi:AbrB family looped-hinge helix DNA binding protein